MKTSDSIIKITEALLEAQKKIETVIKDKTGKVVTKSGKDYEYDYADLASVIREVKEHLNDNGIVFIQAATGDITGVLVATRFMHISGEWIEESLYMPVPNGTPQGYGSAITYAKRYQLQSMTGLPSEDDGGNTASKRKRGGFTAQSASALLREEFEKLPEDRRTELELYASILIARHDKNPQDGAALVDFWNARHIDNDETAALWSLLPSGVRSAIKKAMGKEPSPEVSLAEQA